MGNLTTLENTATQKELTARIWKGRDGWEGRTNTTEDGAGYQIVTHKGRKGLRSYAQKGTFVNGSFTFMMFSDKSIDLATSDAKCTENSIKALHHEGLIKFLELTADEPEAYIIPVRQKLTCYGYAMNEERADWIIYKINSSVSFSAIDLLTLNLHTFDHVRDIEELHGIGTYYTKNDIYSGSIEELNALVEQARDKKTRLQAEAKADAELKEAVRLEKIEEGKKLVTITEGAKFVIVADMYQNDSDSMTDYFSTSVGTTIILAYSFTEKNNMQELKKACLNNEETAIFFEGGKDYEHTEQNSYLPNYFLGTSNWYGWKVNKAKYKFDLTTEAGKNEIYLAAAEGRYFVNETEAPEPTKSVNYEAVEVPEGEIQIIDYSEKAFAVIGETKPIKDQLKELGGRFNFRLSCGAGWIFPKTKLEQVQNLFSA